MCFALQWLCAGMAGHALHAIMVMRVEHCCVCNTKSGKGVALKARLHLLHQKLVEVYYMLPAKEYLQLSCDNQAPTHSPNLPS